MKFRFVQCIKITALFVNIFIKIFLDIVIEKEEKKSENIFHKVKLISVHVRL